MGRANIRRGPFFIKSPTTEGHGGKSENRQGNGTQIYLIKSDQPRSKTLRLYSIKSEIISVASRFVFPVSLCALCGEAFFPSFALSTRIDCCMFGQFALINV